MPYERSKRVLSLPAEEQQDKAVVVDVDHTPSTSSSTSHGSSPPAGGAPGPLAIGAAGPIFAGHVTRAVPKVLALVFVLPLTLEDAGLRPGLLHGALQARDLVAAWIAYIVATILIPPAAGAVADSLSPRQRGTLVLALLAGITAVPLALFLLLHIPGSSTTPWGACIGTLATGIVLAEATGPVLTADLMMLAPGVTATEAAMLANQGALVGLGAAALLVGVPALVAAAATARGHAADLPAARYASIGSLVLSALCLGYPLVSSQQHQRQETEPAKTSGPPQHGPAAVFRALRTTPLPLRRLLLVRTLYQAGTRSAGYLTVIYILRTLDNHASIASTALILAFGAAFLGGLLSQALLAAHAAQRRRRLERAGGGGRRLTVSGSGSGMAAARAAGAPGGAPPQQQSSPPRPQLPPQVEVQALSPPLLLPGGDAPISPAPLLLWPAILAVIFAAVPTEMQLDPHTGTTQLTPSRELGVVYILALLVGLGLGFLQGYERGVLAPLLWPQGVVRLDGTVNVLAGVGPGEIAGVLVAGSALLEWAPTLLYAALVQGGAEAPIQALVPSFGLAFLVSVLFLVWDRLCGGEGRERVCFPCVGGQSAEPAEGELPRLARRPSRNMSFFLLRALPSHLSTIAESPATSHVAAVSPATSSVVPEEVDAPPPPSSRLSLDWTTRT